MNTINTIKKFLREFDEVFREWKTEDMPMVIGGIWALKLHGVEVRDSLDLDIIVYNPTSDFTVYLQSLPGIELGRGSHLEDPHTGENWRSWKLTKNKLTVDFITEWEENEPEGLLSFEFKDRVWKVQGVSTVIEKKKIYNREKDKKDFEDLKRDNF